jgi:hypothetical protein
LEKQGRSNECLIRVASQNSIFIKPGHSVANPPTVPIWINMRDNHLRKEEYFDVANYPFITFSSTSVKKLSDNKLEVTGNLTIKKTTKSVKLVVEVKTVSGKNIFSTSIGLNRRDYGVGSSS